MIKKSINDDIIVDTLRLWTPYFTFNGDDTNWDDLNSLLSLKVASKYKSATPTYTAIYQDKQTGWYFRIRSHKVLIEGSLPKVLHTLNTKPVKVTELSIITDYIMNILTKLGIDTNISTFRISRIDLFRDWSTDLPTAPAIESLGMVDTFFRLKQHRPSESFNNSYIRWANGVREFVIYDKAGQLMDKYAAIVPNNLIRFEMRLINTRNCERSGFKCFKDLENVILQSTLWYQITNELFDKALTLGLYFNGTNLKTIHDLSFETFHNEKKADVLNLLTAFAFMNNRVPQFKNESAFSKYLKSLDLRGYKKSRYMDVFRKILKTINLLEIDHYGNSIWQQYKYWYSSHYHFSNVKSLANPDFIPPPFQPKS